MKRIPFLAGAVILLGVGGISLADTEVGSVVEISGAVSIDAFGTGSFIGAQAGDVLYDTTVVRTDYGGTARISVGGEERFVPSETEADIGVIASTLDQKKKRGWLPSVFGAVKSIFAARAPREESVQHGSRAAEVASDENVWQDEDETLFNEAKALIVEGDFEAALSKIGDVFFPPDSSTPGELEFLRGHALFHLDIIDRAIESFEASEEELEYSRMPEEQVDYLPTMLYEWATALYLTGGTDRAIEISARLLAFEELAITPYATIVHAAALVDAGRTDEAKTVVDRALERYHDETITDALGSLLD